MCGWEVECYHLTWQTDLIHFHLPHSKVNDIVSIFAWTFQRFSIHIDLKLDPALDILGGPVVF